MTLRPGPWILAVGLLGGTGVAGLVAANSFSTTPSPVYISPSGPSGLSERPDLDASAPITSAVIDSTLSSGR